MQDLHSLEVIVCITLQSADKESAQFCLGCSALQRGNGFLSLLLYLDPVYNRHESKHHNTCQLLVIHKRQP